MLHAATCSLGAAARVITPPLLQFKNSANYKQIWISSAISEISKYEVHPFEVLDLQLCIHTVLYRNVVINASPALYTQGDANNSRQHVQSKNQVPSMTAGM
jgi:hypothetical protein